MNKDDFLKMLQEKVYSGEITKSELKNIKTPQHEDIFNTKKIFYIIGGILILLSLHTLISDIWYFLGVQYKHYLYLF